MPRYMIRKLERFAALPPEERRRLEAAARRRVVSLKDGADLVAEGDKSTTVRLFLDGWGYRYKALADGRRQILAFLLPGDLFDLGLYLLDEADHSVGALTPLVVGELDEEELQALLADSPTLARALAWDTLVQAAVQREWTLNVGRRNALQRVAHLLCEVFLRLQAIGLTDGGRCELPLNQAALADATGLSVVHVNRVLQQLRSSGLLRLQGRQMEVPSLAGLQRLALFNPAYLHLERQAVDAGKGQQ